MPLVSLRKSFTALLLLLFLMVPSYLAIGQTLATIIAPADGATNVDPGAPFSWNSVTDAQAYYIWVGSQKGLNDVYQSGSLGTSVTSITPQGLQTNAVYYLRLWTEINGCWCTNYIDTTFATAYGTAHLTYPPNGATNTDPFAPFTWNAVATAQSYTLNIGSTPGASDVFTQSFINGTSLLVPNLRTNTTYYATLVTLFSSGSLSASTTFTTGTGLAHLISPPNGAVNVPLGSKFTWNSVSDAQVYDLYIGTMIGAQNVWVSNTTNATSVIPLNLAAGTLYYARLWTEKNNTWYYVDTTFTMTSNSASASVVGQWSSLMSWPFIMTHAMLLPTGKVLWWPSWDAGDNPTLYDPIANTNTPITQAGYNIFCAGHALMGNGQLLVTGGDSSTDVGPPTAMIYDPNASTWTQLPDMNAGRWYPTNTPLPSGDMLVTSGEISPSLGNNTLPQVWQVSSGSWRSLTGAQLALPTYPEMYDAPGGTVFYAGPDTQSRYLNTTGIGSWSLGPQSNFGIRDYGPSVTYDQGKIILIGGGIPPTASAEIINLNDSAPLWRYTGSMADARRQANANVLPDGTVLVTGGSSGALFDDATNPVFPAELWNPSTGGWTTLSSLITYRGYHSVALLLPDGRVISGGGNAATAEMFSPPYLFKGARPTITSAPGTASPGQAFFVGTPDALNISRVSLIRPAAVTHTFNENQATAFPAFSQATGGLNITLPSNPSLLPPGDYMLFLVNSNGVPSIASFIRLSNSGTTRSGLSLSTTSVMFGPQAVGTASQAITVVVTNVGSTAVTFNSMSVNGPDFAVSNTCGSSLAPGSNCNINVVFQPTVAGTLTETLTINDSDPASPQLVNLKGSAGSLQLSATSFNLGTVLVGTTGSKRATLTLTNVGSSPITFTSWTYSDPEFTTDHASTCGTSLPASSSCTVYIDFTPNTSGTRTGALTISDSDVTSPTIISLTGVGATAALKVSATSFNLGTVVLGVTGSTKATLTLTNIGSSPIAFTGWSYSDSEFSEDSGSTCSSSLAPSGSCIVYTDFTPNAIGTRSGKLTIADSDPSSPSIISFSGVGTEIKFTPTGLGFGNEPVGYTSPTLTLTLTNVSPSATLNISNISLGGANPGDFKILSNACGATVTPNGTCKITAAFAPTVVGSRSATLTFSDDGGGSPQVVKLTGTGK